MHHTNTTCLSCNESHPSTRIVSRWEVAQRAMHNTSTAQHKYCTTRVHVQHEYMYMYNTSTAQHKYMYNTSTAQHEYMYNQCNRHGPPPHPHVPADDAALDVAVPAVPHGLLHRGIVGRERKRAGVFVDHFSRQVHQRPCHHDFVLATVTRKKKIVRNTKARRKF